ncbi:MAG: TfoX/Sxy family protein [Acidimicrobiia bacterium]|nr:TfoX/Sxy family protein [Acidimicrobiia bacterium]
MPGGSKYEGSPEKLEQYAAVVDHSTSDAEVKGAKNPYTSRNGHMFSFLDADGTMALRLSDDLSEEFRAQYDSGDVTSYGATMRGYSSVPTDLLADAETLAEWFDKSWNWIGTLPPKPTKK